jgi:hypothetical protein
MHPRRLLAVPSAIALLTVLVAGNPGLAAAVTHPTNLTVTPLPSQVGNGSTAAYLVTVTNLTSSSTFTLVGIGALTPRGATFVSASPSHGSCGTRVLACQIGPLGPGASATVLAVYKSPASGTSMTLSVAEAAAGYHIADARLASAKTTLSNDPNFVGTWILPGGNRDLETDPNLGSGNPQSTEVLAPTDNIPVALSETNTPPPQGDCPALTESSSCVGQWSQVNVNNGASYDAPFPVTIRLDVASLDLNPYDEDESDSFDDLNLVHVFDTGGYELLYGETNECHFGEGSVPLNAPCLTESVNEAQTVITIVLWTTTNGTIHTW